MAPTKKKLRTPRRTSEKPNLLDELPDDLLVCILTKLSSTAASPSDVICIRLTCKRMNRLGSLPLVLSKASPKAFDINPQNWSESAHRFLGQCVSAGSIEASYTLGMIRFYCLGNRESGASLMAKAAMKSHALSLYSLAVIHFNGSGRSKDRKDLRAGVSLCARAATLGHVDALRELGHCLQDGYGVKRDADGGRRLIVHANTRELATLLHLPVPSYLPLPFLLTWEPRHRPPPRRSRRLNPHLPEESPADSPKATDEDDGYNGCGAPVPEPHPANRFMVGWFGSRGGSPGPGLRVCGQAGCGRPETRPNEFRRCSVCGKMNYCSRGCQAHDWKMRHKAQCAPENRNGAENE